MNADVKTNMSLFPGSGSIRRAIIQRPAYDAGAAKRPFLVEYSVENRSEEYRDDYGNFGIAWPNYADATFCISPKDLLKILSAKSSEAWERLVDAWEDCERTYTSDKNFSLPAFSGNLTCIIDKSFVLSHLEWCFIEANIPGAKLEIYYTATDTKVILSIDKHILRSMKLPPKEYLTGYLIGVVTHKTFGEAKREDNYSVSSYDL